MKLYAKQVLLADGWAENKTLHLSDGIVQSITSGRDAGAEVAKGPIIPGMVNCHSHAFQRAFAGFSEQGSDGKDSFWTWRKIMYGFLGRITPEQSQIIASQLYIEMLKAGYTSVAEFHYLHHQADGTPYDNLTEMTGSIFEAAKTAGIALTHLPVLYRYSGFGSQKPNSGQCRFINSADQFNQLVSDSIKLAGNFADCRVGIAPHSLRATNAELITGAVAHLKSLDPKAPIHIHIAEQQLEVEDCIASYGKRPVEWLLENQLVNQHWCLIHATHVNSQERQALAASGAVAGICPTTEANLGDGIFPTTEYLAEGGALAIGSDSHISVNPIEELRWLEYTQRLVKQQRAILSGTDEPSVGANLWSRAALGGAQSIGRDCGAIAVGKKADLLVVDNSEMSLYAHQQKYVLDSVVFASQKNPILDVMVGGRWVIKNGMHEQQEQVADGFRKELHALASTLS